jgi:hypothetical protein
MISMTAVLIFDPMRKRKHPSTQISGETNMLQLNRKMRGEV